MNMKKERLKRYAAVLFAIASTAAFGACGGHNGGAANLKTVNPKESIELQDTTDQATEKYRIKNGGFETGLFGAWTVIAVLNGADNQAFSTNGIVSNTATANDLLYDHYSYLITVYENKPYDGDGEWVYGVGLKDVGAWGARQGILRSSTFELGGSGYITFKLGGGRNPNLCYVSVRDASTSEELRRFGNSKFNIDADYLLPNSIYHNPDYCGVNLVQYKADLSEYIGRELYLEICDYGSGEWDFLTFDSFETYYAEAPTFAATTAVDLNG
jgi:hypothetical protein